MDSEEKRDEFDRAIGLTGDPLSPDDPMIPEELRGVPVPAWFTATPSDATAWAATVNNP